jgi:hypothetical protein
MGPGAFLQQQGHPRDMTPGRVSVEGQNKPLHPFGVIAGSFKAPWPTQIATESPFIVENDGACSRCEI